MLPRVVYSLACRRRGRLIWAERVGNLVVDEGRVALFGRCFLAAASNLWFVGLSDTPGMAPAAGDTLADVVGGQASWSEFTGYFAADRPEVTFNGPTATGPGEHEMVSTEAEFAAGASHTITGVFLCNRADGGSGFLYSAAPLSSPQPITSADLLGVTCQVGVA